MGKRTTTTREYDHQGRLVRETVLEETTGAPAPDVQPLTIYPRWPKEHVPDCCCARCRPDLLLPQVMHTACTCPVWPCPMHHVSGTLTVQSSGVNHSRSHEVAAPTWRDNNAGVYR
jgi:hypothetical protein